MKHIKLILISLVCVIATMTKAQESSSQNKFFEDGKSWLWARHHYKLHGDSIGFYYKKDTTYWTETVVEDTIVDGHHAKKLLIGDSLGVPKEPHHYKIYLEESEMPKQWYNVRADMKNKPAPLLNPATLKPMTAKELSTVFCDEIQKTGCYANYHDSKNRLLR